MDLKAPFSLNIFIKILHCIFTKMYVLAKLAIVFIIFSGTIPEKPPIIPDKYKTLEDPFSLNQWIAENRTMIEREGKLNIFGEEANYQFRVGLLTGIL